MPDTSRSRGVPLPDVRHLAVIALVAGLAWLVWKPFQRWRNERDFRSPSSSGAERIHSLEAFVAQGGESVPKLIGFLSDPQPKVRRNAAMALGLIGPAARDAVPGLVRALDDSDSQVRDQSLWALGRIRQDLETLVPRLVALLTDNDERLCVQAAEILVLVGPAAVPAIVGAIEQFPPQKSTRGLALIALHGRDNAEAVATVRRIFRDRERELAMRSSAFGALVALGGCTLDDVRFAIRDRMDHPAADGGPADWRPLSVWPPDLTAAGMLVARRLGPEGAPLLPDLLDLLDRSNDGVLDVLTAMGPVAREAIPRVMDFAFSGLGTGAARDDPVILPVDEGEASRRTRWARHSSEFNRLRAIRTAWQLGADPEPLVELLLAAAVEWEYHSSEVVKLLVELSAKDARRLVPQIVDLLDSESARERLKAARLLTALGPDAAPAAPRLIEALENEPCIDDHEQLGSALIEAVGAIGSPARDAVPFLCNLLPGAVGATRGVLRIVVETLGKLGPEAAEAVPLLVTLFDSCSMPENTYNAGFGTGPDATMILWALGKIGVWNDDVRERVEGVLNDPRDNLRAAAICAYVRLEPDEGRALAAVAEALEDPRLRSPSDELLALGDRGTVGAESLALLVGVLEDERRSEWTRRGAALALGRLSTAAETAVPALRAALARCDEKMNIPGRSPGEPRPPGASMLEIAELAFPRTSSPMLCDAIRNALRDLGERGASAP